MIKEDLEENMSASDRWGEYKTPCFKITQELLGFLEDKPCGGVVEYWYFGPDDSYSPGSSGIQCKKCRRLYTAGEWGKRE